MSNISNAPQAASPVRLLRQAGGWLAGTLGPLVALVAVVVAFGVAVVAHDHQNTFFTLESFRLIASETSKLAIPALGMTVIVIAGGIDLSAGMAIALSAVIMATTLKDGWSPPLALLAAVLTGVLVGLANGLLVSSLRLVPFIATLGMMSGMFGVAKIIAGESGKVVPDRGQIPDWLPRLFYSTAKSDWLVPYLVPTLPGGVWLMLGLALALAAILHLTVFGRYVFAIGSNESTARLCGINVPLTKVLIYSFAGLFVGLRGVISFAELGSGDATAGAGLELRIIAAVVIGGSSLSGGRGSVLGTLAGAGITATINHGCTMLEVRNPVQDIIIGLAIILAVVLDQFRQRRMGLDEGRH